jgi:hypothetical protein
MKMIGLTVTTKQAGEAAKHVVVNSLEQAQRVVRIFIDNAGIGSSEFEGGQLRLDGKLIGRISYNGRAWHRDNVEMAAHDSALGVYAS